MVGREEKRQYQQTNCSPVGCREPSHFHFLEKGENGCAGALGQAFSKEVGWEEPPATGTGRVRMRSHSCTCAVIVARVHPPGAP